MHAPFVPGRSQRIKWWWTDFRSAHVSQGLAVLVLAMEGVMQALGGLDGASGAYRLLGLGRDGIQDGHLWQLVSHALVHGGWVHAGLNALLLVVTGARVERIGGSPMVAKVFAAGVISGGLFFLLFPTGKPDMVLVGASGGIFALLLWLATVSPQSRMWPVPLSARSLGWGLIVASGALAVIGPWLPGSLVSVAHGCHFGGALAGWLMARRLLRIPVGLDRLRKERARRESADGPDEIR